MRGTRFVVTAALAALLLPAAPAAAGAGELTGRVAGGGAGLASVCVFVEPAADGSFGFGRTGDDGRYRVTGLAPGPYVVTFTDCDPEPRYAAQTAEVEVGDGVVTLDAELLAGGFVSGRVTAPGGAAAAGVCVEAVAAGALFGSASAVVARDGTYRLGPLAPGEWIVGFDDCRDERLLIGELHRDAASIEEATPVTVSAGATVAGIDAELAEGARIVGTVREPSGRPLPGACVLVGADGGFVPGAPAVTGADGSYVVGGLRPGRYDVAATRCTYGEALRVVGGGIPSRSILVDTGDATRDLTLTPVLVERLFGADRVATAAAVALAVPPVFGSTIVLARDDDPADALSAAPLAAALDAPLLVTSSTRLSSTVVGVVNELGIDEAIVVGGPAAVTPAVERQLDGHGVRVRRVAGADRYETAARIATELGGDAAWVVGADAWPDALGVGAVAGPGEPILLTARDRLPDATRAALSDALVVTVVGGPGAVSDAVLAELGRLVPVVARVPGADRYETNRRLLALADPAFDDAWVASGRSWTDGLVASAAASRTGAPLVLVDGHDLERSPSTAALLAERRESLLAMHLVGGEGAITAAVAAAISGRT